MDKQGGTPDFYLVKGITDFRCGIIRLSERITQEPLMIATKIMEKLLRLVLILEIL